MNSLMKVVITVVLSFGITQIYADTHTWVGALGGDWHTATNWSPAQVPESTDDAIIPSGSVIVNTGVIDNSGDIDNFGTIDNNLGTINNYVAGRFDNDGVINNNDGIINNNNGILKNLSSGKIYNGVSGSFGGQINNNGGTLVNEGDIICYGAFTNTAASLISNKGQIESADTITNFGTWNNFEGTTRLYAGAVLNNESIINNSNDGYLESLGGRINNYLAGVIENSGSDDNLKNKQNGVIENQGTINHLIGPFENDSGCSLNNYGTIHISSAGEFMNNGDVNNENGGQITIVGNLYNYRSFVNLGAVSNGGYFVNDGNDFSNFATFQNTGTFENEDNIDNYGNFFNEGSVENKNGRYVYNEGVIANNVNGVITNLGTIENSSDGIIENNDAGMIDTSSEFINDGGLVENDGTIVNTGSYEDFSSSSILKNNGSMDNDNDLILLGTLENNGFFNNLENGYIENSGTMNNKLGGEMTNEGVLESFGSFVFNGLFTNSGIINFE